MYFGKNRYLFNLSHYKNMKALPGYYEAEHYKKFKKSLTCEDVNGNQVNLGVTVLSSLRG